MSASTRIAGAAIAAAIALLAALPAAAERPRARAVDLLLLWDASLVASEQDPLEVPLDREGNGAPDEHGETLGEPACAPQGKLVAQKLDEESARAQQVPVEFAGLDQLPHGIEPARERIVQSESHVHGAVEQRHLG